MSEPRDPEEMQETSLPEDLEPQPAEATEALPADEPEADAAPDPAVDEAPAAEDAPVKPVVVDDGIKRRWYALHAHAGQEDNVRKNLLVHAEQAGVGDLLGEVLVPKEDVAEIKSGEKRISKRKFLPGYVLVQLPEHPERHAELWHMIKETPGVSGFIGSRNAPVPLDNAEVNAILEEIRGERERPKPKVKFEEGERVKIIDGPFSNFVGNVADINFERGTLKVMVEIFERLTSIEVEFWQVEKV